MHDNWLRDDVAESHVTLHSLHIFKWILVFLGLSCLILLHLGLSVRLYGAESFDDGAVGAGVFRWLVDVEIFKSTLDSFYCLGFAYIAFLCIKLDLAGALFTYWRSFARCLLELDDLLIVCARLRPRYHTRVLVDVERTWLSWRYFLISRHSVLHRLNELLGILVALTAG